MAVEFKSNLGEVLDAEKEQIALALDLVGVEAVARAALLCPVGTPESTGIDGYIGGRLRNSITHATQATQGQNHEYQNNGGERFSETLPSVEENTVVIGTNVEYAPYVECGTKKMKAQPFLKPAIEQGMETFKKIIESTLKGGS